MRFFVWLTFALTLPLIAYSGSASPRGADALPGEHVCPAIHDRHAEIEFHPGQVQLHVAAPEVDILEVTISREGNFTIARMSVRELRDEFRLPDSIESYAMIIRSSDGITTNLIGDRVEKYGWFFIALQNGPGGYSAELPLKAIVDRPTNSLNFEASGILGVPPYTCRAYAVIGNIAPIEMTVQYKDLAPTAAIYLGQYDEDTDQTLSALGDHL